MNIIRKGTKEIKIGSKLIGADHPIAVQSMCSVPSSDVEGIVRQILALEDAGCEIVRIAIPDLAAAKSIYEIKKAIHIPLVADIHFDYNLAIEAVNAGADKIRINPGNIGSDDKVFAVVRVCKEKKYSD